MRLPAARVVTGFLEGLGIPLPGLSLFWSQETMRYVIAWPSLSPGVERPRRGNARPGSVPALA